MINNNHDLVARQRIKGGWNGGIGVPAILSQAGTSTVASTCLNWLKLASYSWKGNSTPTQVCQTAQGSP